MVLHRYKAPGRYAVSLKAIDPGTCKVKDSASVKVDIFIAQGEVQDDDALCLGSSYQLKANGCTTIFLEERRWIISVESRAAFRKSG